MSTRVAVSKETVRLLRKVQGYMQMEEGDYLPFDEVIRRLCRLFLKEK